MDAYRRTGDRDGIRFAGLVLVANLRWGDMFSGGGSLGT